MHLTGKGQITIPILFRKRLGILPDTDLEMRLVGHEIRIRRADRASAAQALIARIAGTADAGLTTDEILAMTRGEDR